MVPLLKKKSSSAKSNISSVRLDRKISSPTHKLTYTRLQKRKSDNSYLGSMISPSHLMDADFQAYEDNSYEHIYVHPYETPIKIENNLDQEIPFGLFRNFSIKESENG